MKKKEETILSIFLIFPFIIGFVLALFFNFQLDKNEWIILVTSCVSTSTTIFLGYMVFFQTENHKRRSEDMEKLYKEKEEENRKQDLLIRTTPMLAFEGIDYFFLDDATFGFNDDVDFLKYNGGFDEKRSYRLKQVSSDQYDNGVALRFVFICNENKGLKNIIFRNVNVCHYSFENKDRPIKKYSFENKAPLIEDKNFKISYIGNNKYQTTQYFMFPADNNKKSTIADYFKEDLLKIKTDSPPISFNIEYEAINIYGIKINCELKFRICVKQGKDKLVFSKPTNVSNWIDSPELIKLKSKDKTK